MYVAKKIGTFERHNGDTTMTQKQSGTWFAASIALVMLAIGLGSCGVTQSVTLVDADVTAPAAAPPIHITNNAQPMQIMVSPFLSLPSEKYVKGTLELTETDTHRASISEKDNLVWRIPKMEGGVNVDFIMTRHFAFGFGMNLSSLNGRSYGGWSTSVAMYNEKENQAVRFELGLLSTPVYFRTQTVVVREYSNNVDDTTRYFDYGKENYLNAFGSLTINTTRKTWPVNLFLNAYVTKQQFIDLIPGEFNDSYSYASDSRASASQWIVGLTPGLYVQLMDDVRLVVGERIIMPFDIVNQDPFPLFQFHMQMDIAM